MSITIPVTISFSEDCKMSGEQKKQFAESITKSAVNCLRVNNHELYPCETCNKLHPECEMKYFDKHTKIGICNSKECCNKIGEKKFKDFINFVRDLDKVFVIQDTKNDEKIKQAWKMYNNCMTLYEKDIHKGIIDPLDDPDELLVRIVPLKIALKDILKNYPPGKLYDKTKHMKIPGSGYEILEYYEFMANNF
jgi:hypothetical protein